MRKCTVVVYLVLPAPRRLPPPPSTTTYLDEPKVMGERKSPPKRGGGASIIADSILSKVRQVCSPEGVFLLVRFSSLVLMTDATRSFEGLTWPDYVVIAIYFIFVLVVGIYVSSTDRSATIIYSCCITTSLFILRQSSWRSKRDSVEGYFLSSRNMGFVLVRGTASTKLIINLA